MNELVPPNTSYKELALPRHGIYDKDVEIFVNGKFYRTYLSQVRVGMPWHLLEGPNKETWFVCQSPIKIIYPPINRENPAFIMGAMQVLQAPPTLDPTYQELGAPRPVRYLTYSDVEDVELK